MELRRVFLHCFGEADSVTRLEGLGMSFPERFRLAEKGVREDLPRLVELEHVEVERPNEVHAPEGLEAHEPMFVLTQAIQLPNDLLSNFR